MQKNRTKNFTATASILGYQYQIQCALLLLLKSDPTTKLSIERFDDILLELETGKSRAVQTKHQIKPGSLTDRSQDLWKTLRIWCDSVLKDARTLEYFKRVIITTASCPENSAASKLCQDETKRDFRGALDMLLDVASNSKNASHQEYYQLFLDLGKERQLELLRSVYILDSAPNIIELEKKILEVLSYALPPRDLPRLYERLLGWWSRRVQQHLIGESTNGITNEELRVIISDFQRQQFPDNLSIDYRDIETPKTEEELSRSERIFVKQLHLIDVKNSQMIAMAIGDYYRAYHQRLRWVREKAVIDQELYDYEGRLVDEWKVQSAITTSDLINNSSEDDKKERGRRLLNWVYCDALLREDLRIRPKTTEPYVMRGSYHMLSNDRKVGWHPDFQARLRNFVSKVRV